MDHQRLEYPNLGPFAQVSTTPNTRVEGVESLSVCTSIENAKYSLSQSITPWARPIRRMTSWLDPPSLGTTLPRYVKFFKIRMSSPHALRDCTVSSSTPLNTWTLVLASETLSPRASPPRALPVEPLTEAKLTQQRLVHHQQIQDL